MVEEDGLIEDFAPGLVLLRKPGERVLVRLGAVELWVSVLDVDWGRRRVRLHFSAPPEVRIDREEVVLRQKGGGG